MRKTGTIGGEVAIDSKLAKELLNEKEKNLKKNTHSNNTVQDFRKSYPESLDECNIQQPGYKKGTDLLGESNNFRDMKKIRFFVNFFDI